jgi:hypothetical protein
MVTVEGLSDTAFQKYNLNPLNKINFLCVVKHSLKIGADRKGLGMFANSVEENM